MGVYSAEVVGQLFAQAANQIVGAADAQVFRIDQYNQRRF
jgi:hypothetical protein